MDGHHVGSAVGIIATRKTVLAGGAKERDKLIDVD